ncbi:PD-(D/E)XK nuclease family protein [Evansella sp. AB-rgal1]|uniref:PD-(D/E)XK nuclease family protein n=1 Tax=Evansella sp. AB-rgal1 TaxID=3242696 RepID=UPI00359DD7DF
MKSLIQTLHHICQNNLLKEKVLVVDSYFIGEQILFHYMKQGHQAINVKIKTIRELALDSIGTHMNYIDNAIGSHLFYLLLKDLKDNNRLTYFHELEVTPSLSHGMYEIVQELRLAGYTSETLTPEQFVSTQKGLDMIKIVQGYERLLEDNNLADDAMLYENTIANTKPKNGIFLIQNNLKVTKLQEQFLECVTADNLVFLPLAPVYGVTKPRMSKFTQITEVQAGPLSYIYDLEGVKDSQTTTLPLFTTKTEEQEVKQVIQRIATNNLALDDCVIFYSQRNPYVTIMYHLAEKEKLPVTFQEGVPIRFTRPGKLISGIVKWIKHSYSTTIFIRLLQEGLFNVEEGAPSKSRWSAILRNTKIGWDQSRYLSLLESELQHVNKRIEQEEDNENRSNFKRLSEEIAWLIDWYKIVLSKLPSLQSRETVNYHDLLQGLLFMVEEFSKVHSLYDQTAKETLREKIDNILPYVNQEMTMQEAIFQLEEFLLDISIGASPPKAGHLHVSAFSNGVYVQRKHVFVVGLDNRRFPGVGGENPLLLDIERKRLGEMLTLLQDKPKEKMYQMLQLLASSSENVTVSYCQFDVNENRLVNPSHLFLQCYRYQSGNSDADFKQLKDALPISDAPILNRKDWWTEKLATPRKLKIEIALLKEFKHIMSGLVAQETRDNIRFTEFDGKIGSDTTMFDPRLNKDIRISAGKLEMLATCPYSFFLQEVLKIKPLEETEYDPTRWLDPATRGSLLHEIYEKLFLQLQEREEKPSVEKHTNLIKEIATESIEKVKLHVPAPSKKVEYQETEEILESCEMFLKIEEENSVQGTPKYFEYTFGVNGQEPAMITLPSGSFLVSGKIDRVDELDDKSFHIIDYKTGGTYGYEGEKHFKGGRQLQHLLYTLAIESHLSLETGTVQKSSYLFPTKKGLGQVFEREQEETMRTNGIDILDKLLTIIQHGDFAMTEDVSDCKYCDFKQICRRSTYDNDHIELKHQDKESVGVRSFKGVRAYD